MKKSFILHIDSLSILAKMPDDMAGKFIKLIYHFQLTGELLEMDFALEMAITPFINQFERDNEKYSEKSNTNRINGLSGGRPKKQTEPKKSEKTQSVNLKAKKAYNDNDSDNVSNNDSVKDNVSKIPTLEEFGKYAIEHKPNADKQDVKLKYKAWIENDWKDGNNNKIINWKSKLLQTLPHIRETKITEQPINRTRAL